MTFYRIFAISLSLIFGSCAFAHSPPVMITDPHGVRNAPIGSVLVDFDHKDDRHDHVLESFPRGYSWAISAIEFDTGKSFEVMFCGGWPKQYNHAAGHGCFVTTGPFVDIHEVDEFAPEFNDALEGYLCINAQDVGKSFKVYKDSQDFSTQKRTGESEIMMCRTSLLKD